MANNVFNQFLMHSLNNGKANEGMPAVKLIAWLLYDVNMLGVWAYALNITFQDHVAVIEKALLCIASLVFFAFRIRSLHLDNQKKEIDNWNFPYMLAFIEGEDTKFLVGETKEVASFI